MNVSYYALLTLLFQFFPKLELKCVLMNAVKNVKAYCVKFYIYVFQAFNIIRYKIGQKYDSHYDALKPSQYGPGDYQRVRDNKTHTFLFALVLIRNLGLLMPQIHHLPLPPDFKNNFLVTMQVASFLLYLTDVQEGGETMFPFEVKSSLSLHFDSLNISHFLVSFFFGSKYFSFSSYAL